MRRRTVLAAAAAALAVGLTGCGIPDETDVRDIRPGPAQGEVKTGGAGDGPPARQDARTKEAFVDNFLAAVAGEPGKVEERYRSYLPDSFANKVDADAGVNLVRLRQSPTFTERGPGTWLVKLDVDQVGVLRPQGWVAEPKLKRTNYTFDIALQRTEQGTDSFVVTRPPQDLLLLSTTALEKYFTPRTVYFWSLDQTTLVPDERYMPNELDQGRQPTRIVDWVVDGPSGWIESVVSRLPEGAKNKQNVPYPKDQLQVALTAEAAEQKAPPGTDVVRQLGQQLMWSLHPYVKVDLQLWVDGLRAQVFTKDQAFYAANAANRGTGGPEEGEAQPERFAILDGQIHRLRGSPNGGTQPLPQLLLTSGVNEGVISAALARESAREGLRTAAALVFQENGQYKLRLVTAVGDGAEAPVVTSGFTSMGRAVWLKAPMDVGLVVANRGLYQFTLDGSRLEPVALPDGLAGKVVDVSASPDGRRIAVVANGRVHVLSVSRGDGVIQWEVARLVPTTLTGVSAVDWSEETKLVVAGTGPEKKPAVWEVSLDGAIEKSQFNDTGGTVGHLVAYPDDPIDASISAIVMYAREGAAFDLDGTKPGIEANEVMGASGEVDPAKVTAPFFLLD